MGLANIFLVMAGSRRADPRLPGATRTSEYVVETDYRDVVNSGKPVGPRSHPRPSQQFGLPRAKTPTKLPPHTRLMKWLRPLLLFPDDTKGWVELALDTITQLKERDSFDAILSSSPLLLQSHCGTCQRTLGCAVACRLQRSLESGYVGQK